VALWSQRLGDTAVFLGLCASYWKFLFGFSKVVVPLSALKKRVNAHRRHTPTMIPEVLANDTNIEAREAEPRATHTGFGTTTAAAAEPISIG
jgi:hypothetical protein